MLDNEAGSRRKASYSMLKQKIPAAAKELSCTVVEFTRQCDVSLGEDWLLNHTLSAPCSTALQGAWLHKETVHMIRTLL